MRRGKVHECNMIGSLSEDIVMPIKYIILRGPYYIKRVICVCKLAVYGIT